MTLFSYHAHGLRLDSAIELHGLVPAVGGAADLTFVLGRVEPIPIEAPAGTIVLESGTGGPGWVAIAETSVGWVIRYPGFAECRLDRAGVRMEISASPDLDPDLVGILAIGNPLAWWIALEGDVALHASAIVLRDRTIAFVGPSGTGKSTLASTMAHHLGALVVSDDLLRVNTDEQPVCFRGAVESRLRAGKATDAVVGDVPTRATADGRVAVRHEAILDDRAPLDMIVLPRPHPDVTQPRAHKIAPADALFDLLTETRLVGWRDPTMQRRQFEGLADLVDRVPVVVADVPWGRFEQAQLNDLVDVVLAAADAPGEPPRGPSGR